MTNVVIAADKRLVAERQQIGVVQVAQTRNTIIEQPRIAVVLEARPAIQYVVQSPTPAP